MQLSSLDLMAGIIFSILSSIFFALGIILQKKALMEMSEVKLSELESMTQLVKNKTWAVGIVLALLGGIPYLFAQAFIGVTLVQPLTLALQLIFTVLLALKYLEEHIGIIEALGFLLLMISPLFLILGNVTPPDVELNSEHFFMSFFIFVFPVILVCSVFLLLASKCSENVASLFYAIISGLIFAIGAIVGQIGVEIIKVQFSWFFLSLVFLFIMLGGNAIATVIQQLAFQKGKIGIAIAIQSTANLLLAIYGGILLFNQQILLPIFFLIGIIMIVVGNLLLVQFQARIEELEEDLAIIPDSFNREED